MESKREGLTASVPPAEYRAWVGIECPRCHQRHFLDLQFDRPLEHSPEAFAIRRHLEAWVASRCPYHLGPILQHSKN